MRDGTDFTWLQTAEAQESEHQHGPVIHGPHPDRAHFAFRHGHEYDVHGPGAMGTYSNKMFAEMGGGDTEGEGPKHDHLEHLTQEEWARREVGRRIHKEERVA